MHKVLKKGFRPAKAGHGEKVLRTARKTQLIIGRCYKRIKSVNHINVSPTIVFMDQNFNIIFQAEKDALIRTVTDYSQTQRNGRQHCFNRKVVSSNLSPLDERLKCVTSKIGFTAFLWQDFKG